MVIYINEENIFGMYFAGCYLQTVFVTFSTNNLDHEKTITSTRFACIAVYRL